MGTLVETAVKTGWVIEVVVVVVGVRTSEEAHHACVRELQAYMTYPASSTFSMHIIFFSRRTYLVDTVICSSIDSFVKVSVCALQAIKGRTEKGVGGGERDKGRAREREGGRDERDESEAMRKKDGGHFNRCTLLKDRRQRWWQVMGIG